MAINDSPPQLVGSDVNKIMSTVFFDFSCLIVRTYKPKFAFNLTRNNLLFISLNFMDDDGDEIFLLLLFARLLAYLRLFAR